MKKLSILLLVISPLFCIGQNKGKIVRNQSVKAEAFLKDSSWWVDITNMNSCISRIELNTENEWVMVGQYQKVSTRLYNSFILKVRNATPCPNGTTEWLTLDSGRLIDEVSTTSISIGKIHKKVNCETIKTFPVPIKRDSIVNPFPPVGTKM